LSSSDISWGFDAGGFHGKNFKAIVATPDELRLFELTWNGRGFQIQSLMLRLL
jgi:hypothetical protein